MPARRRDIGFAVAAGTVLAGYNNLLGALRWHRRRYVPVNACATGAAVPAAVLAGLTPADLGLASGALPAGLRLGSAAAAAMAGGWLLTAALPATRPVLRDQRAAGLSRRDVAYQALVRIPAGTVLWEETAFRGVLLAALRRVMPDTAAVAVASGVFGVWHIRPTIEALRVNRLAPGRGRAVAAVTAGCAATAAGGAVLSWLRLRSASLAAPVLLHLAANCPALLAAWAFTRPGSLREPPGLRSAKM
ncbi:MAG: CPBP family intramembrane metalloprotease [Nocardiopsaceae bacterium]|nr:CPBP family intramembrane metalloprotease [Nocardiopsaceae bacterium]